MQPETVFTAALVRAQVSGYVGEMVKLPSGANLSWRLSKIEWSIFSNTTWIATYHKGTPNINWFYQFKGRLSLNTTSGKTSITSNQISLNELLSIGSMLVFFH